MTVGAMCCGALAAAAVYWAAVPAYATTPRTTNERMSGSNSFVSSETCVDRIRIDSTWSVVVHSHYDAAARKTRVQYTGKVRITYTDLVNKNVYSPNSSGPGTEDVVTGTTWVRGRNGAVFTNDGVLVATSGRIVYDADGNIVSIVGRQRPVCATLGTRPLPG